MLIVAFYVIVIKDKHKTVYSSNGSYIKVYGRDGCGNTQRMRRYLKKDHISYDYYNVDDKKISIPMNKKMREAGIDTSYYLLPVVEVNGKFFTNPHYNTVIETYYNKNKID
ncbi:glutaredoxin family protein [Snodgrassella gandavensis]|uniref:glutaredoxin family protein n=1 Tax=Snodgrassella gandavensis TaxID=2946698 RepID=UPI001EF6A95D|nr:glutaredoxin domain-containing protein [Snodgrassella gandavensis]